MAEAPAAQKIFPTVTERAGALLLDLVFWIFLLMGIASVMEDAGPFGALAFPLLFLLYFAGLPASPLGATPGKRLCGMKICDRSGGRVGWRASLVRAGGMLCWIALVIFVNNTNLPVLSEEGVRSGFLLAVFLPWAPMAVTPRRQSAFDLLAGTVVLRRRADEAALAGATQGPGWASAAAGVLLFLVAGAAVAMISPVYRDKDRQVRVRYALGETEALRGKIEAFHAREGRWPSASDLGVAEWTPYPAGGGYRLKQGGLIEISFSVLPELKGRSLTLRPVVPPKGNLQWRCTADAGLKRSYLPASCRAD